jgi:cycloeucalenol cycloisomerase
VSRWLSRNPDKAFGEKLFLAFAPVFFAYNALMQGMGWLDAGTFWHVVQNLGMWLPWCVLLPAWLRRGSGVRWRDSYWWKLNVYMAVWVFCATYFHTEYFFVELGLRYRFPSVAWTFDSTLVGPAEATAAAGFQKVPVGMYLNTMAFFIVYHSLAVVCMRRVREATRGLGATARRGAWLAIVVAAALFFAFAETRLYISDAAVANVWYVDVPRMLRFGTFFYALYFIVSFPSVYRLDEEPEAPRWTLSRCAIEAAAVSLASLLLLDLWARWIGPIY